MLERGNNAGSGSCARAARAYSNIWVDVIPTYTSQEGFCATELVIDIIFQVYF